MKKFFFPSIILILFLVGCQSTTSDSTPPISTALPSATSQLKNTSQPTNTPQPTSTPLPTDTAEPQNTATPFAGGECDSRTERIDMDVRYNNHITGGYYPEGCYMYCLWVPTGKSLTIGISDFSIDCDLYVDKDLSVLEFSDHGAWQSNDYGTGDEQVTISNPDGRYYVQVCTYDVDVNLESDFVLYSIFTP